MAKQVVTLITDDIDGSEADRTVEFAVDGVTYTIDLSDKNIGKLRKALDPYIAAGTRVTRTNSHPRGAGRTTAAPARVDRQQNQAIREWAAKNGYEISDRGRIPAAVMEAFHNQR
ncbi:Lsr2 family protein [Actinoplanes sp. NPDC049118]|uniref:histone-like nucleoid-structuring protein Lsr2 n=1 Tax=Actinoplanes sp. NPDC049118 TaxID=3155769 RepID=UPI0033D2D01E